MLLKHVSFFCSISPAKHVLSNTAKMDHQHLFFGRLPTSSIYFWDVSEGLGSLYAGNPAAGEIHDQGWRQEICPAEQFHVIPNGFVLCPVWISWLELGLQNWFISACQEVETMISVLEMNQLDRLRNACRLLSHPWLCRAVQGCGEAQDVHGQAHARGQLAVWWRGLKICCAGRNLAWWGYDFVLFSMSYQIFGVQSYYIYDLFWWFIEWKFETTYCFAFENFVATVNRLHGGPHSTLLL